MKKFLKKIGSLILSAALILPFASCAKPLPAMSDVDFTVASISSVDALGRTTYASY